VRKLASEVRAFVGHLEQILEEAARSISGVATLSEVEVSASVDMGENFLSLEPE
jgi:hypothetical protein